MIDAMRWPSDVDPSAEQARDWVVAELAKGEYHDSRSLLERLMRWLADRVADLTDTSAAGGVSLPPIVLAVVVVLIAAAVGALLSRVRRERRTAGPRAVVLGASVLTADELRALGSRALAEQRWADAVRAFTRAIAREAETRNLLIDAPSLTAHEIGDQLSLVFPAEGSAVRRVMDLFDAVAYGRHDASLEDAQRVRSTEQTVRRARPVHVSEPQPTAALSSPAAAAPAAGDESLWTTGPRS